MFHSNGSMIDLFVKEVFLQFTSFFVRVYPFSHTLNNEGLTVFKLSSISVVLILQDDFTDKHTEHFMEDIMALTPGTEYDHLLRNIKITKPKRNIKKYTNTAMVIDARTRLELWYPRDLIDCFKSLSNDIQKHLKHNRNFISLEFPQIALFVFLVYKGRKRKQLSYSFANFLEVSPVPFQQIYISPLEAPEAFPTFRIGKFTIGSADSLGVQNHTYSNYVYPEINNNVIIKHTLFTIEVLNAMISIDRLSSTPETGMILLLQKIKNLFFSGIASFYLKEFWNTFRKQQKLYIALGAPFLDSHLLEKLTPACFYCIFTLSENNDFPAVIPIYTNGQVNDIFDDIAQNYLSISSLLKDHFEFSGFNDNPGFRPVKMFIDFMFSALEHFHAKRFNDCALHLFIALETLGSLKENFKERVIFISALAQGVPLPTQKRLINKLYCHRNAYVHGQTQNIINPEPLGNLLKTCQAVLFTLLNAKKIMEATDENLDISWWLKEVDKLIAKVKSKEPVADAEYERLGIVTEPLEK